LTKPEKNVTMLLLNPSTMGTVSDQLLLHTTGMKLKNNSYRKVNNASAKVFDGVPLPAYAYPRFKTQMVS